MEISTRKINGHDVVELSGRFDAYEVPKLTAWFDSNANAKYVIINMKGVGFIDSSGLAALVKGLKRSRGNGGELYMCNLQQAVRIIFELTRLDKAFTIFDDEAAALNAVPA